jgi:hypothetical protein
MTRHLAGVVHVLPLSHARTPPTRRSAPPPSGPRLRALLHVLRVLFDRRDAHIHGLLAHLSRHVRVLDQRVLGLPQERLHVGRLPVLLLRRHGRRRRGRLYCGRHGWGPVLPLPSCLCRARRCGTWSAFLRTGRCRRRSDCAERRSVPGLSLDRRLTGLANGSSSTGLEHAPILRSGPFPLYRSGLGGCRGVRGSRGSRRSEMILGCVNSHLFVFSREHGVPQII